MNARGAVRPTPALCASLTRQRCAAVLSDRNPLVVSRQLLTAFANDIRRLPPDVLKARSRPLL